MITSEVLLPAMTTGEAHTVPAFSHATPFGSVPKSDAKGFQFEFWTEEENRRFAEALEAVTYPPDFKAVSVRVGSKSEEQCTSYASLYLQVLSSLQAHRKLSDTSEAACFRLTAQEVYTFHGIGHFYSEFLQRQAASRPSPVSPGKAEAPAASGKASSPAGGEYSQVISNGVSGSKSSISFLCESERAAAATAQKSDRGSLGRERHWASPDAGAVKKEGDSGSPGKPAVGGKRGREEEATEDLNSKILAVPHEALWEYSAMQESILDQARNRGKNPWDWVRKVINKSNGYAQWWPFFSEYVILTKREASEDLKSIRAKAPPLPPQEFNPYSRKFEKCSAGQVGAVAAGKPQKQGKGSRASPEASEAPPPAKKARAPKGFEGRLQLQPGDFIEVKWGLDWWHAQVVKVGRTSRTGFVWVSYVGGTEEDEEWIAFANIRLPMEDVSQMVKGKKGSDSIKTVRKKASALA